MIPESFIQDLLNRLDIVEVVGRYLPLKRAGANYSARCPFHSEQTPSFTVSPTKQFYHCFGCGAHGTAIGFVMEYGGLGFVDAVKELAASVGMRVPEERRERPRAPGEPSGEDLAEVLMQAVRYYREQLKQAPRAIDYLKRRGVSGEVAARFGIGYAPPGWRNLEAVFPDYDAPALLRAGLVVEGEQGRRYDRFRDRIMFPIQSQRGTVIGFGGRVLEGGEPKYLNSPETPLFEKGRELYGLVQARPAVREAGRVLVVEGYMDVVGLACHGVGYAVATLGTACTPQHVQKLLRLSDEVVFCFDGDEAGRRAAWRALENSLPATADGKTLSFLFLPAGEDPDSYVASHGRAGFEALLAGARPLSDVFLAELCARFDLGTDEGRAALGAAAKPYLNGIAAAGLGLLLRKRVAQLAGYTLAEYEEKVLGSGARRPAPSRRSGGPRRETAAAPSERIPRALFECLVAQPRLVERLPQPLPAGGRWGEALAALAALLRQRRELASTAGVLQACSSGPLEAAVGRAAAHLADLGEDFDVQAQFDGALARIAESEQQRLFEALRKRPLSELSEEEKEKLRSFRRVPSGG